MPGVGKSDAGGQAAVPGREGESAPGGGAAVGGEQDAPALTARETTVLEMLIEGWRNTDIARELGITERTVKFHVSGLFTKLGVQTRTQVVAKALREGLLDDGPVC